MKKLATLLLSAVCAISVMAETKTATFTVSPQMTCANCENKIKSNLRFENGVLDVTPSVKKQTVVVQYDSDKTNVSNLKQGFTKIGYTATETVVSTATAQVTTKAAKTKAAAAAKATQVADSCKAVKAKGATCCKAATSAAKSAASKTEDCCKAASTTAKSAATTAKTKVAKADSCCKSAKANVKATATAVKAAATTSK
jgi:copper chaperone CopZ